MGKNLGGTIGDPVCLEGGSHEPAQGQAVGSVHLPSPAPCTSGPSHSDSCVLGHVHTALLVLLRLHTHSLGDMLPSTPILHRGRRLSTEGAGLTHSPADGTCDPDGVVTVPSLSLVSDPVPRLRAGPDRQGLVLCTRTPHSAESCRPISLQPLPPVSFRDRTQT